MSITSVKFPARWFDPSSGGPRFEMCEFRLGPGPCGKTVQSLRTSRSGGRFRVVQVHTDNTSKLFCYSLEDITGRIEIEMSA